MLGRPVVDAVKAERWGLVNEVVADDLLDDRVEEVVQEFVGAATASVGLAKSDAASASRDRPVESFGGRGGDGGGVAAQCGL